MHISRLLRQEVALYGWKHRGSTAWTSLRPAKTALLVENGSRYHAALPGSRASRRLDQAFRTHSDGISSTAILMRSFLDFTAPSGLGEQRHAADPPRPVAARATWHDMNEPHSGAIAVSKACAVKHDWVVTQHAYSTQYRAGEALRQSMLPQHVFPGLVWLLRCRYALKNGTF